jgi:hypothetical protein
MQMVIESWERRDWTAEQQMDGKKQEGTRHGIERDITMKSRTYEW